MKNVLIIIALLLAAGIIYATMATENTEEKSEILTMNVSSQKADCVGVGPQKCLVIDDLFFYDSIDGFEHKEGFEYVLKVERTKKDSVPADSSIYNYKLVEVVSKTEVQAESNSSLAPVYAYNWLWQESRFNGGNTTTPTDPTKFELVFMEGNRFSSTTDCNNASGSVTIENGTEISFGPIASTKKACLGETFESEYLNTLSEITTLSISGLGDGDSPTLSLMHENGEMIFNGVEK